MKNLIYACTIMFGLCAIAAQPLSFAEKAKIAKFSKAMTDFKSFNEFQNFKQKTAVFKVTACKDTVKDLFLVTTANCRASGNPDGYVCSLMKLSDAELMDPIDFVENSSFFIYSRSKSKLDLIRKLGAKANGNYVEFYVMVEKDKDMKTLFDHSWRYAISSKSGRQPAFWVVDTMAVDRFELGAKREVDMVEGRTLTAIAVEKNKSVRYKVKCDAGLSTSYRGSFDGYEDKFYAIELYDGTKFAYCYIPKNGVGKNIFEALSGVAKKKAEAIIHIKQNEIEDDVFVLDEIKFLESKEHGINF